jgi:uncharacterized protein YaaQ
MLLLVAVIQSEDAPALTEQLLEQGLRLTQINSTGGLFATDSIALLLGIEEERYDDVIAAIVATCKTRTAHISTVAMPDPTFFYFTPMEVEVGGAVVFCVPVEQFLHLPAIVEPANEGTSKIGADMNHAIQNGSPVDEQPENVQSSPADTSRGGRDAMKLIVAIVKGDDADDVIRALLAAGHRLTRINTTGGFLRRGNATLLIGVEAAQVDEVINLIQESCPRRSEPAPLEKGFPEYAANVFVLDASHFVRV